MSILSAIREFFRGPPGQTGPQGMSGMYNAAAMCEFCYLQESYYKIIDKPICKACSKKVIDRIKLIFKLE